MRRSPPLSEKLVLRTKRRIDDVRANARANRCVRARVIVSRDKNVKAKLQTTKLRALFRRILNHFHITGTTVELHFNRSPEMKKLNWKFRSKNKATDVLSFPDLSATMLGSIVIDIDTARKQAAVYRHSTAQEIQELFIHGVLHLLGFDHEKPGETRQMKKVELLFCQKLHTQRN